MRRNGTIARMAGASVSTLAREFMTHGGFYKHFATKDDLNAAAVGAAFGEIVDLFDTRESASGVGAAIRSYYLSKGHIEQPDLGCPVAALGADAGRGPETLSAEFAAGAEALIMRLSPSAPPRSGCSRRSSARWS